MKFETFICIDTKKTHGRPINLAYVPSDDWQQKVVAGPVFNTVIQAIELGTKLYEFVPNQQ
ncbi:hypothetical protein AYO47_07875 [Planctomyces sp. SCGC AG-212-M04]|nr:hypothetical protein AYO47_07875 [Planctomyces sp. SCGC AG-212-M04]